MSNEMQNVKKESLKVTLENVEVVNITSASNIARIAQERSLNPQDVFVRCTFKYDQNEFTASNKLRFLGQSGYQELLDAIKNKTPMKFTVDINNGFFYIEHDVSIESLFAVPVETKEDNRKDLSALLNTIGG